MIPVTPQPEPSDFDANIRQPGLVFLKRTPLPKSEDFKRQRHWKYCHQQLHTAYRGICAYSARWIPYPFNGSDQSSVDHFIPKAESASLAYEWSNYRLASARLNNNKDKSVGVLDPFWIKNGWFVLDFATLMTNPGDDLPPYLHARVVETIDQLDLNHNDFINQRVATVQEYSNDVFPLTHLEDKFPFIAYELKRQNLVVEIKPRFRTKDRVVK